MPNHDELIPRFVEKRAAKLDKQVSTSSRLSVILDECGWKKRSGQNLQRIQAALDRGGLFTQPRLTMRTLPHERIFISAAPVENRTLFANESDLRDFIISNFSRIGDLSHLRDPEPEVRLRSRRRIDILARDRIDDAYVVIELKKPAGDVVDDMTSYLREVDETKAIGKFPVRGMVILGAQLQTWPRHTPLSLAIRWNGRPTGRSYL